MISEIKDCSGCGVCYASCPVKAIEPVFRERGVIYYRENDKCIKCGLCLSVCPSRKDFYHEKLKDFYAAKTRDKVAFSASASGGIGYELARSFISQGDVIYGAAWDFSKQKVVHKRVESLKDLKKLQGSKYVQSIITREVYEDIRNVLLDKKVLFIGCPCQVAAVRSFTKDHANLYCVDIICHGVSSEKLLSEQIKLITKDPVIDISFRDGLDFRLKLTTSKKVYEKNGYDNPYYSLYLNFASLREQCYSCRYAQQKRVGDITLGDYVENKCGLSFLGCNSRKGELLLDQIRNACDFEKKDIILAEKNVALFRPTLKSSKVDRFTKRYRIYGLEKAYYLTFLELVFKRKIRSFLGDNLYSKIKSIKRWF